LGFFDEGLALERPNPFARASTDAPPENPGALS
jgi:hypothetical protein